MLIEERVLFFLFYFLFRENPEHRFFFFFFKWDGDSRNNFSRSGTLSQYYLQELQVFAAIFRVEK